MNEVEILFKWWRKSLNEAKLAKGQERIPLKSALKIAEEIIKSLGFIYVDPRDVSVDFEWQPGIGIPVGSLRREKPDVGDIDIIVTEQFPIEKIMNLENITDVSGRYKQVNFVYQSKSGEARKVNIFVFLDANTFGAALLHTTGPNVYNVRIRNLAKNKLGMSLSQNGLKDKNGKMLATPTERSVQEALGVTVRTPKERAPLIREDVDIKENPKFEYFYFNKEELKKLDKVVKDIISQVAKKVPTVISSLPFSINDMVEKIHVEKQPMKMVAEDEKSEEEEDEFEKWKERFKGKVGTKKSEFSPEEEEEYLKLRKKYYGKGGEIEKAGIGSVKKDMPKGIGELTPEEFEEYGYVLKVPKEVLNDFDAMVGELKTVGSSYEEAKDWYHSINKLLKQETPSDSDAALLGLLVAIFSPRAKFALNLIEAAFMYKAVAEDVKSNPKSLEEYLKTFAPKKDINVKTGEETKHRRIGHLKVANFALNLVAPELAGKRDEKTGELEYNEIYRWNSTIDTWMIDSMYPLLHKASTAAEYTAIKGKMMSDPMTYTYLSELVAKKAKEFDLLPHELQAIIWVAMQRRQSEELSATTKEAVNQLKSAIVSVYGIKEDIGNIEKELEESNWIRFLFKRIDKDGIEEAGKIVLGAMADVGGKATKVPGVRSIVSRGKKGDLFKYFPEEPKSSEEPKKKGKKPSKEEPAKAPQEEPYENAAFKELKTHYVLNSIIQMPTGKMTNLHNVVEMYLKGGLTLEKAANQIISDFERKAKHKDVFLKELNR